MLRAAAMPVGATQASRLNASATLTDASGSYLARGSNPLRDLLSSVYPEPETEGLITSIAPPTTAGKTHYRLLIGTLKKLGLWSSLANGFLFGSAHQASTTTQKSIKGGNDATGTGNQGTYFASMNGTSHKYTYAGTAVASSEAHTVVTVFQDTNQSTDHVSHAWSMYAGGAAKGPAIYTGGSTISGTYAVNTVFGFGSTDGSATTGQITTTSGNYGGILYTALRQVDNRQVLTVHGKQQTYASLASLWLNATDRVIGASGAGAQFLAGRIFAVLEFDVALTDSQLETVLYVLRYIVGNAYTTSRFCAFEGNSLTASASGGGSSWPAKLLAKTGWSTTFTAEKYANHALDGAHASTYNEQTYYMRTAQFRPVVGERNILFVWEGVNDITAGVSTERIVSAIDRHLTAAYADGWDIYVMPITPVAATADGLTYGYSAAQLQQVEDVNDYLQNIAGPRYGTFLDLRRIGDTYQTFLDPTSTDYYVPGDGLHHSDAGRGLIADYAYAQVTP